VTAQGDTDHRRAEQGRAQVGVVVRDGRADPALVVLPLLGSPARLAGRETIGEFATRARDLAVRVNDLRTVAAHQTVDPEVVVVEIVTVGEVIATGETFEVPGIQVFRIRDEKIVLFRDYFGGQSMPDTTPVS
jgi:hypothetical protein